MNRFFFNLSLFLFIGFFNFHNAGAQGYQEDSLQIKVYTTLVVDKNLKVEEVLVRKLFCNYCNEDQAFLLKEEAKRRTFFLKDSPEYYRKPGKHKMALYIRMSKEDFKNLKRKDQ